jgi:hypothetical protein
MTVLAFEGIPLRRALICEGMAMHRATNINQKYPLTKLWNDYRRRRAVWLEAYKAEGTASLEGPNYPQLKADEKVAAKHMDEAEEALIAAPARTPQDVIAKLRLLSQYQQNDFMCDTLQVRIVKGLLADLATWKT